MQTAVKKSEQTFTTVNEVIDWFGKDVIYSPPYGDGAGLYTLVSMIMRSEFEKENGKIKCRDMYSAKIKQKGINCYLTVRLRDIKKAVTE